MEKSMFVIAIYIIVLGLFVTLTTLVIKALVKYINSKDNRVEKNFVRETLGNKLKEHRLRCKMTQEFVAEALGVSRQAVSKWENGASDPSTSNLIAAANLFGISLEELVKGVEV